MLDTYPRSTAVYNIKGAIEMALKNYEQAIKSYQKALEINEGHPDLYYNLGNAYREND